MSPPLHLLDRIVEIELPRRLRALKAPSFGERLFEDHFAGFPLMPGVLMVEAMVQAGQWLCRARDGFPCAEFPLERLERAVFTEYVRPGSVLDVVAEDLGDRRFKGSIHVGDRRVASCRFQLSRRELDSARPSVRSGARRVRETFEQLGGEDLLTAALARGGAGEAGASGSAREAAS